jgi:hypothetical protein
MEQKQIIAWLLEGDVSLQYQVYRDLLGIDDRKLQERITREGWGKSFISRRNPDGHWGERFYQPKWTSTHYTLLDIRNLCPSPDIRVVTESIDRVLESGKSGDGGIRLGPSTIHLSDVCVNGMFLNYASYFRSAEHKLHSIVDCILKEIMPDGGFNCRSIRSGASHSSLHSTLSVLEGFMTYQESGYSYRLNDVKSSRESAEEFILTHQLYLSDRTGKIIHRDFLKFSYPGRWRYDILRAMDYFQYSKRERDERMEAALGIIRERRNRDGTWNTQAHHPGQVHFLMEKAGMPGRWNTLRALRVLKKYPFLQP